MPWAKTQSRESLCRLGHGPQWTQSACGTSFQHTETLGHELLLSMAVCSPDFRTGSAKTGLSCPVRCR
eukprot:6336942-Pyramimonas_sp.AAC.1